MKGGELLNIATVFSSSTNVHTSNVADVTGSKHNRFASLLKDTPITDASPVTKELKHLLTNIKELLQFENGKELIPDNKREILPIVLKQELEAASLMLHEEDTTDVGHMKAIAALQQILMEHGDTELSFTEEQISNVLEQLEVVMAMVEDKGLTDENLANVLAELDEYLQVEQQEIIIDKFLSDFVEQLAQDNLSKEDVVNLAQSLVDFLGEIPEEVKLSNELMTEMEAVVLVLEQQMNIRNVESNDMFSQLAHRLNEHTFMNQELDSSRRLFETKDFQNISKQAHDLIEEVLNEEQTVKINKQIAQLLDQAQQFKQVSSVVSDEITDEEKSEVDKIWSNLQSMYDKRTSINKGGSYVENAKVRSSDIGLWLEHMVSETNTSQAIPPHMQLHQQMTPVEQYVMHVRTQEGSVNSNEQMMQQFQQIVNQSAIGKNQFFKQLSITIQPEQLGEITIRFVQMEGELIAKITVTSHATKSALESNLHQLKNMFAPHQVMIEKQDGDEPADRKSVV